MGQGVVTQNFQSPSYHHYGNQKNFNCHKRGGGLSYGFGNLSLRGFQKHVACPPFMVIGKLQLPFEKL
jgi:hypothetical protein